MFAIACMHGLTLKPIQLLLLSKEDPGNECRDLGGHPACRSTLCWGHSCFWQLSMSSANWLVTSCFCARGIGEFACIREWSHKQPRQIDALSFTQLSSFEARRNPDKPRKQLVQFRSGYNTRRGAWVKSSQFDVNPRYHNCFAAWCRFFSVECYKWICDRGTLLSLSSISSKQILRNITSQ